MATYWVYIMTNRSGTLYIGMTGDLARRVHEHRHRLVAGFTARYRIDRLVHAESFPEVRDAIAREKQIKGWDRAKKLALIAESNPDWKDLGDEWFGPVSERAAAAQRCHADEGGISADAIRAFDEDEIPRSSE